jgi:imidazolonepropionase-like amidohydrolase
MPPAAYTALIDEARQRKLQVAAHLAFIAELKKRNVGYIPTPTRDLSVFQYESTPASKTELDQALRNLKRLSDGGVMIAMGTDSGTGTGRWQGYSEHVELELMVKAGMTPMQTLVAATGNAAKVMGIDKELGTLQAGQRADFVVLNADPLSDIRNTRAIESVWIDGRRISN